MRLHSVPTDASWWVSFSDFPYVTLTILWQGQQNLAWQFCIVPLCWLCLGGLETWTTGMKAVGGRTPHPQQLPLSACFNITFHTGKGGSATHMGYSNRSFHGTPLQGSPHISPPLQRGILPLFMKTWAPHPLCGVLLHRGVGIFFPFLLPFSFSLLFPFLSLPFPLPSLMESCTLSFLTIQFNLLHLANFPSFDLLETPSVGPRIFLICSQHCGI